jgi:heme exporter protein A
VAFERVVVDNVTKVYGPTRALAGVSLVLDAGTVTVLEGPNGAGKSTLLGILATLARPTSGTVRYGDLDARDDIEVIRPEIGLVAHEALVYPDLTARESLRLFGRLYEIDHLEERVAQALAETGLVEIADRAARTFSRGQLQRLSLARAQLHAPKLMLFDEPTTGLDAASTERAVSAIERARDRKKIVVVVTHDRVLAERVATKRVRLERGRVV